MMNLFETDVKLPFPVLTLLLRLRFQRPRLPQAQPDTKKEHVYLARGKLNISFASIKWSKGEISR